METKFDSDEEYYFNWYISELKTAGYIDDVEYHPKPFLLSEKVEHQYRKEQKTKTILVPETILQPHSYQADWIIWWNQNAHGIFYTPVMWLNKKSAFPFLTNPSKKDPHRQFSIVDIKGTFIGPHNNSAISFPLDQKWVYAKYNLYVQKIVPTVLFEKTFTPLRYLKCDHADRPRKIDFAIHSLDQYLQKHPENAIVL